MNSELYIKCPICRADVVDFQGKVKKSTSINHYRYFPVKCKVCGDFEIVETALNKLHIGSFDEHVRSFMQIRAKNNVGLVNIPVINNWLNDFDKCLHTFSKAYLMEIEHNPTECVKCNETAMKITNLRFSANNMIVEHTCTACGHRLDTTHEADVAENPEQE